MKPSTFKYLLGTGIKNVWVNKLMTVASIGVLVACMSIIGAFLLITVNVDKTMQNLEKENVVMVYFNDINSVLYGEESDESTIDPSTITEDEYLVHNEEEAKAICEKIEKISNVNSVEYVSKEEGLEQLKESVLSEDSQYFDFLSEEEYGNPLSDGARVTLTDLSQFTETIQKIEAIEGVESTQSQAGLAEKITAIKNGVTMACFWIVVILMIISFVIVSNTIRVTMYTRKLEISIMKAVGATNAFIRIPFVVEGVVLGLISAFLSTGILYFIYKAVIAVLQDKFMLSNIVPFKDVVWYVLAIFVVIGVMAGLIGSVFMIGKYLRKEGSEFSAI